MLKKILVIIVAVLVVLAIVGLLLPRKASVARSITIARPASVVYATAAIGLGAVPAEIYAELRRVRRSVL